MKDKSNNDFGYLGQDFQKSLLKIVIEDKKFGHNIIDVTNSKYFDNGSFRILFQHIKEFYEKYKKIPEYETIEQKIKAESTDSQSTIIKMYVDTLNLIKEHQVKDPKFVKEQSINFCKQQTLKKAINDVQKIMNNGSFQEYNKIEEIIQNAMQVGVNNDEIVDVLDNPESALDKNARETFPTGINGIDELLKGGLAKKELGVLLAPTGVGKTTFLTKVANSTFLSGGHVLQIFFEDNINSILRKHYTIFTGILPDDQPYYKDQVIEMVNEKKSSSTGSLKLMKLSSYGTTLSDIRSKIRKHINENNNVDMVIIDYVDCITSEKNNGEDEWKGEGAIMRGIESMADEFNCAIWVATQGDRSSITTEVVQTNQMGGSIKKAQIGHVIVSVGKTLEQKENKLATITMLKSRIGGDGVVFSNCKFDNGLIDINTDSQNTLLGHKEEIQQKKINRIKDVYTNSEVFRNNSITNTAEILLGGN